MLVQNVIQVTDIYLYTKQTKEIKEGHNRLSEVCGKEEWVGLDICFSYRILLRNKQYNSLWFEYY